MIRGKRQKINHGRSSRKSATEGGPSRRLATDEHGKTRKEAEAEEQAKDLPRINTEFHGNKQKQKNKICQGISRKQNTAFRAGCVRDGLNNCKGDTVLLSSFSAKAGNPWILKAKDGTPHTRS